MNEIWFDFLVRAVGRRCRRMPSQEWLRTGRGRMTRRGGIGSPQHRVRSCPHGKEQLLILISLNVHKIDRQSVLG
jgi:hypothetical protein